MKRTISSQPTTNGTILSFEETGEDHGRLGRFQWPLGQHDTERQHNKNMKEPGLDNRHRDQAPPKAGQIQQKRGDAINKNLPEPIKGFSPNARLDTMRKETGKTSVESVRQAAKGRR